MDNNPETFIRNVLNDIEKKFAESGTQEVCGFRDEEVMVPMRDGIRLQTFVYSPDIKLDVYPVILQRTCYPFWDKTMKKYGELLAKRGYSYIYQYCRGQNGSEGEWAPNIYERNDGIDTVNWIAAQPWAGRIGVWGESYGALIGWAMADAVKDKVASMFLGVYGTDRFVSAYQKGSFRHDILTSWSMENAGFPIDVDYLESCRYMPQARVDEDLWGQKLEWYRDYILNSDIEDSYWQTGWWKQLREIPSRTEIPLYITSGWYDHHHGSTMATWARLNDESKKHSCLEVGGWNHFGMPCLEGKKTENDRKDDIQKMLNWFDMTLVRGELPERGIRLYEVGKDSWIECRKLDELVTKEVSCYLDASVSAAGRELRWEKPEKTSGIGYIYDPQNPVMSHGAESLLHTMEEAGSLKQPEPDWREDVVSFVSSSLSQELRLWGKIRIKLFVKSDCEDTAFTAKLMEVDSEGNAYNIRSSITTIAADRANEEAYVPGTPVQVEIEMWDILYTLPAGSRLRMDISSSDFPQYNVHSNYAGKWALQEKTKAAHQTILCGGEYPSEVILPVRE